jgi:hypothetical protein
VLIDVPSGESVVRGLCVPHSPRWWGGQLWVLESGAGGLGVSDEATGTYREACRLPGFTRGLDFAGPYALVGLSQVRESPIFSGVPISDVPERERCCGVWAVDTRTGRTAGFVWFVAGVHEVFAVQVLGTTRWPDVLDLDHGRVADTYQLPDGSPRLVPPGLRMHGPAGLLPEAERRRRASHAELLMCQPWANSHRHTGHLSGSAGASSNAPTGHPNAAASRCSVGSVDLRRRPDSICP